MKNKKQVLCKNCKRQLVVKKNLCWICRLNVQIEKREQQKKENDIFIEHLEKIYTDERRLKGIMKNQKSNSAKTDKSENKSKICLNIYLERESYENLKQLKRKYRIDFSKICQILLIKSLNKSNQDLL